MWGAQVKTTAEVERAEDSELAGPVADQGDVPLRGDDGRGRRAVGWTTGVGVAGVLGVVEPTYFRPYSAIVDRRKYAPFIPVVPCPIVGSAGLFDSSASGVYFFSRAASVSTVADMFTFRVAKHLPTLILAPPEQI